MVGEVLAWLARLGYVTSEDGKTFALRRVAKSVFQRSGNRFASRKRVKSKI